MISFGKRITTFGKETQRQKKERKSHIIAFNQTEKLADQNA